MKQVGIREGRQESKIFLCLVVRGSPAYRNRCSPSPSSQRNPLLTNCSSRGRGDRRQRESGPLGLRACDFGTPSKTLVLLLDKCRKAVNCAFPLKTSYHLIEQRWYLRYA